MLIQHLQGKDGMSLLGVFLHLQHTFLMLQESEAMSAPEGS